MIKKALKDPFMHFIFLGLLVFIVADGEFVFSSGATEETQIVIDKRLENLISLKFKSNQGRLPSDQELMTLTEQYVREEILVREAIKLGLDENDHVIRSRLVELVNSIGLANNKIHEPSESGIKQFADERADRYSTGGSFSFEQIFLGKEPTDEVVLNTLQEIEKGASPVSLGVKSKLTYRYNNASKEAIISMFGGHVFQTVLAVELGQWSGAVKSPVGVHLVRVLERVEPTIPPVDEIKHRLVSDWKTVQKGKVLERIYEDYRSNYQVIDHKGNIK